MYIGASIIFFCLQRRHYRGLAAPRSPPRFLRGGSAPQGSRFYLAPLFGTITPLAPHLYIYPAICSILNTLALLAVFFGVINGPVHAAQVTPM